MGNQYTLLEQGCTSAVDLEAVMDSHDRDGVITRCERERERAALREAITLLEAACWRKRVAEWESKHLPGTPYPHYIRAGRRDLQRMLYDADALPNPPTNVLRFSVRRTKQQPPVERRLRRGNEG
jgi:hypothetical protein